jgi:hypothetical protein
MEELKPVENQTNSKYDKRFWRGAIIGSLAMLFICSVVGGTVFIISMMNRNDSAKLETQGNNIIKDETLKKLRVMCIDEVKRINGIINFEKAVRYQRSEE